VDVDSGSVAGHLRQCRSEACGAAVLKRLDQAAFDELERRLDQLLARERVADLHRRPLVRVVLAELRAREHRCSADAVASGRCAEEHHVRADGCCASSLNAPGREEADAHRVDETVVPVGLVENRLTADRGDADAVAVAADACDGAPEVVVRLGEAQTVEDGDRPGAHRDDVAEDSADSRGRPLEGLDCRRVVVRLDLERDSLAAAEVDHARVLARPLQHAVPAGGEAPQQRRRVLVAAVLRPEQREDGELEVVRVAFEQLPDAVELLVGQP
jgi:hypothetical protein